MKRLILGFSILSIISFSGCSPAPSPAITKSKTTNKNIIHLNFKNRLYPGFYSPNKIKIYYDHQSNNVLFFARGTEYHDDYLAQNGPNANTLLLDKKQQKILNHLEQIKDYSKLEDYGIYMFHLSRGTSGDPIYGTTSDVIVSYYYITNYEKIPKSKEIEELLNLKDIKIPKKDLYRYAFLEEGNLSILKKLFKNNLKYDETIEKLIEETYKKGYIKSTKYLVKRFNIVPKQVMQQVLLNKDKNFIKYVVTSVPNYTYSKWEEFLYNKIDIIPYGDVWLACDVKGSYYRDCLKPLNNKCLAMFQELFPKSKYIQKIKDHIDDIKEAIVRDEEADKRYERILNKEKNKPLYVPSKKYCEKYKTASYHDDVNGGLCYAANFQTAINICRDSGGSIPHIETLIHFAKKLGAKELGWNDEQNSNYLSIANSYGIDVDDKMMYWTIVDKSDVGLFDSINIEKYEPYYGYTHPHGVICVYK